MTGWLERDFMRRSVALILGPREGSLPQRERKLRMKSKTLICLIQAPLFFHTISQSV
jgi:hypothetical protein